MTYDFVAARYDYGPRKGPVRAFLIHMAEGGGTVGFLSRSPARGVSVHYVIEYSGRIVQMLSEAHASGSVNPQEIRTTDDPDGFYGATTAKAVMGSWWNDPNSAVISVEIEGFAADGPNAAQAASLVELVDDVRTRFPDIGLLGHRDFADYKACPGKHIDWPALGGHGAFDGGEMFAIRIPTGARAGTLTVPAGTDLFRLSDGAESPAPSGGISGVAGTSAIHDVAGQTPGFLFTGASGTTYWVRGTDPGVTLTVAGDATPFAQADVDAAAAAAHDATKAAAIAAVQAIP